MGTLKDQRDDTQLLAAVAGGDRAAFADFYRRHQAAVVGMLARETGDRELAADLAAEVFAAALLSAARYRPDNPSALPWLYGIARNKAHESRRRGRAHDRARTRLGIASELTVEDDLERIEELAGHDGQLLELVEQLPDAQRDALRARVIDERDYAEIARDSGSSEAAVRQRVSRALAWLRSQTVGTITFVALLIAVAAGVVVWSTASGDPSSRAGRSLPAALEVLRRPQLDSDRPEAVLAAARRAAAAARVSTDPSDAPFAGSVDPALMRRLTTIPGGNRVYLVPVSPATATATAPITAAFVILTDANDRPLQRPYGLTANRLRGGAFFISYGLRSERPSAGARGMARMLDGMRSLQVQVVPDGVARVDYRYSTGNLPFAGGTRSLNVATSGNAAVAILRGRLANTSMLELVTRDRRGDELQRVAPSVAGSGEVPTREICRGVALPPGPTQPARVDPGSSLHELCRQSGAPLRAYRSGGSGAVYVLYPPDSLIGAHDGGRIGLLTHIDPADFPPRLAEGLPPAERLGR